MTGIGLVTGLGDDRLTTWQRLLKGESAIQCHQPFASQPPGPLALIGSQATNISSLLIKAVTQALVDADLSCPLPDCGVVIGSSRSNQAALEGLAEGWLTTGQFPNHGAWMAALPHMGAMSVAALIGAEGPVLAPMAACATGLVSLAQAQDLILSGQCERVLVGAVEAPITPLTLAGFRKMGVMAQRGCYPFDLNRDGLVLGEGAAIFVLESSKLARHRFPQRRYGRLLGIGLGTDAYHVSTPAPDQGGSRRALMACLRSAQLSPEAVDYIHAHGTATPINDSHEAALLRQHFGDGEFGDGETLPLVSSTKGATGHTLGASGALGAAFCLMALQHQVVPPNVGLKTALPHLNLVHQAMAQSLDVALCLSFGFGGQNAVAAFGR